MTREELEDAETDLRLQSAGEKYQPCPACTIADTHICRRCDGWGTIDLDQEALEGEADMAYDTQRED